MKIFSYGNEIAFSQMTFPDGQRHVEIPVMDSPFATIETAIRNADDLMDVLLAKSALDSFGCCTDLDIRYMLGARMDRAIGMGHPETLRVICRTLNAAGFRRKRVLDPHSEATTSLMRAEAILPRNIVDQVLSNYHPMRDIVIIPDAGARNRINDLVGVRFRKMQAEKHRDSKTGKLSEFKIEDPSYIQDRGCLIIDDICDGGGTFVGLAKVLLEAGAKYVDLYITHGIFSKGTPLDGIRRIYTTDSYKAHVTAAVRNPELVVMPVMMQGMDEVGPGKSGVLHGDVAHAPRP